MTQTTTASAAAVIFIHSPHEDPANLARVYPDFPTRAAAWAFLAQVARPQDYWASFLWRRKPEYVRGDRFLKRLARKGGQGRHE